MSCNGALTSFVSITACCANVSPLSAVIIVLVLFSVLFFDKIKIDDPVGAISVHGVCGAWGTLAAGLFDSPGNIHPQKTAGERRKSESSTDC